MADKQADFMKVIETGTVDDIQEFLLKFFHRIKHTESFSALLSRLRDEQFLRREITRRIDKLCQELYVIKDMLKIVERSEGKDRCNMKINNEDEIR